jgi:hypothetical protein
MNGKQTNHLLLAAEEKPRNSSSPLEWASMFAIAFTFVGLVALYMHP